MKVSQEPVKIADILKDKTFNVPLYQWVVVNSPKINTV